jgi:membrane-bound ClpP family serine protease
MWTVIASLIIVGLLLILLEILVIPGSGVAGIFGFVLMFIGVWMSYDHHGTPTGHYVLGATILLNLVALSYALRSKSWDKAMLKTTVSGKVNEIEPDQVKPGDTGITTSRCAPTGKAIINGQYFEVFARSEFLTQDTPIEVIRVERNKIFVKSKTS